MASTSTSFSSSRRPVTLRANRLFRGGEEAMADVKREAAEELDREAEEVPQPMEGLGDAGPAPFVLKTYEMVADATTDAVVSWGPDGRGSSFVVWDPYALAAHLLPRFFKHSNFASFLRQLNTYGFRKVNPNQWEYANEGFLAGQKHLLKNIKRRRSLKHLKEPQPRNRACVDIGWLGSHSEVENLKRDSAALRAEVLKLRQQYNNCKSQLIAMEERVLNSERKRQQTNTFYSKACRNPLDGTGKRQRLMGNADQHMNVPLTKEAEVAYVLATDVSAGSSVCGRVEKDGTMPRWDDQNLDSIGDVAWEELDAIPGTELEQEDSTKIDFDAAEFFVGKPCGWADDCPYLAERMQFVEH